MYLHDDYIIMGRHREGRVYQESGICMEVLWYWPKNQYTSIHKRSAELKRSSALSQISGGLMTLISVEKQGCFIVEGLKQQLLFALCANA